MQFAAVLWRHLAKPESYPCVVLEKGRRWDDYGYDTRFSAYFLAGPEQEVPLGFVKILQQGVLETHLLEKFSHLDEQFCSVGQDLEFYQRVSNLGPAHSRDLLLGIRDIVFSPEILRSWPDKEGLRKSLMRSSEALKAFREAGALFGRPSNQDQGLAFTFTKKLSDEFDEPHQVRFDFRTHDGGLGRVMVLVGKNGTGKTALLAHLAEELSGLKVEQTVAVSPQRPNLSSIIAISYSAFDKFERPQRRFELGVSYFYCGLRTPRKPLKNVSKPSADTGRVDPDQAMNELNALLREITALNRRQRWMRLLEDSGLFEDVDKPEALDGSEASRDEWFNKLSSGHKIVLMILTNVLARIQNGSMLLFDEPELHLHPQLLSNLLRSLHQMLEEYNSYAILATHSPLILQETPGRAIRIIERRGKIPFVADYPGESFGENLTELIHTAFRVDEESRNYIQVLKKLVRHFSRQQIAELFDESLSLNVRMTLRALTDSTGASPNDKA